MKRITASKPLVSTLTLATPQLTIYSQRQRFIVKRVRRRVLFTPKHQFIKRLTGALAEVE